MLELVFHGAVHNVRKSHTSAVIGLVLNVVQASLMIAGFYLMFTFAAPARTPSAAITCCS